MIVTDCLVVLLLLCLAVLAELIFAFFVVSVGIIMSVLDWR